VRMLGHMSSSQVTLLRGEFQPPKFFPSQTQCWGGLTLGFAPNFQFIRYHISTLSLQLVTA